MAYVYISYSHQDRQFVDRLAADLNARGIEVWVDRQQLEGGSDWSHRVATAIQQAAAVLVVVSKYSSQSFWVRLEFDTALGLSKEDNRPVIPLLIDNEDAMPANMKERWYLDFRKDYRAALNSLVSAFLPDAVRADAPVVVAQPKAKGYFFLSYAEEDTEFVLGMRQFLEERKYGYFDYQESERDYYGTQMFLELERQISQAAAVFCVMSPDWKISQWAPKEYLFALDVGIPTFLLLARPIGPTLLIAGVPYIDFVKDRRKAFGKLDKELRRKKLI